MYGADMGELRVESFSDSGARRRTFFVTRRSENAWKEQSINLAPRYIDYQVKIEGIIKF